MRLVADETVITQNIKLIKEICIMSSCLLIVNPSSGKERAKQYVPRMKQQLERLFDEVEVKETQKAYDATAFAKQADEEGKTAVFCMGGDGTLNETINGLAQAHRPINFGFVPFGTANDLARALKIPLDPGKAIDLLPSARTVAIDLGKINDRYFINIMAAGALPKACEEVSTEEKTMFGVLAYFIKGIQAHVNQRVYTFKIETDVGDFTQESSLLAAVLTNSIGSFETAMPGAKVNDGKIHLVVFKDLNMLDTVKIASQIIIGNIDYSRFASVHDIQKARISLIGDEKLSTTVDGEKGPDFPLEIEVLPSFLKVYVPKAEDDE